MAVFVMITRSPPPMAARKARIYAGIHASLQRDHRISFFFPLSHHPTKGLYWPQQRPCAQAFWSGQQVSSSVSTIRLGGVTKASLAGISAQ